MSVVVLEESILIFRNTEVCLINLTVHLLITNDNLGRL